MVGVRAMGRKFAGDDRSCNAAPLGINFTAATFQVDGTTPSITTLLKRSNRAGCKDGHLLKMVYEIWSRGDGDDEALDLLIILESSSRVIGHMFIDFSESGGDGNGIHDGLMK